jgi:4-amino-4-deoxy-L-arabinose transferase-like glycosyltransferase
LVVLDYSPVATWCLQALLGVIATLLIYALVRRLGGGPYAALAAALLYALDFEVLAIEHKIQTETLASFLLLIAAHLAVTIVDARRASRAPAAVLGLVLAYLCLVRPDELAITVYLAVALTIAVRVARSGPAARGLRGAVGPALWILVPPLVVLAAWTGFNRAAIGVTSVDTVLGYNMIGHVAAYVRAEPGPNYPIDAAYVAARARREQHTSDLVNLRASAQAAMERASHLNAAHLGGRLESRGG